MIGADVLNVLSDVKQGDMADIFLKKQDLLYKKYNLKKQIDDIQNEIALVEDAISILDRLGNSEN